MAIDMNKELLKGMDKLGRVIEKHARTLERATRKSAAVLVEEMQTASAEDRPAEAEGQMQLFDDAAYANTNTTTIVGTPFEPTTLKMRVLDKNLPFPGFPERSNPTDAGLDIRASESLVVKAGDKGVANTNLMVAIPKGFTGMVAPRSGLAKKFNVTVSNAPGIIDSGYRGEVKVLLSNHSENDFIVNAGDRVAQLILVPVALMPVEVVTELPAHDGRGTGGFGSTGR